MDDYPRRVTLQQLAQQLQLHHTTVSRALRGHPRIAAETVERVQRMAEKLGYSPDPYLAGLSAYRQGQRKPHYVGTLAWVTNWPEREGWRTNHAFPLYFEGAMLRAQSLGYTLEEFWFRQDGERPVQSMLRMLRARGIQGLLFAPQPESGVILNLDLSHFSAVTFGYTLRSPRLHTVTSHSCWTMISLLRHLSAIGYQRPGLACYQLHDERVMRTWSSAFWAYGQQCGKREDAPCLLLKSLDKALFTEWVERCRPDVVLSTDAPLMHEWLLQMGMRVPEDIGIVPVVTSDNSYFSGMNENGKVIGATAVDLLISMLHRNERGVPEHPQRILIEGTWVDGYSVCKRVEPTEATNTQATAAGQPPLGLKRIKKQKV